MIWNKPTNHFNDYYVLCCELHNGHLPVPVIFRTIDCKAEVEILRWIKQSEERAVIVSVKRSASHGFSQIELNDLICDFGLKYIKTLSST